MASKITKWDRQPNKLTDEFGIEWTEQFSVWSATVGGIIPVQVSYDGGTYKIQVAHRVMKNNAETPEKGRQRAIAYIKQQMRFLFRDELKFWVGGQAEVGK